jgi:hypothetical protein
MTTEIYFGSLDNNYELCNVRQYLPISVNIAPGNLSGTGTIDCWTFTWSWEVNTTDGIEATINVGDQSFVVTFTNFAYTSTDFQFNSINGTLTASENVSSFTITGTDSSTLSYTTTTSNTCGKDSTDIVATDIVTVNPSSNQNNIVIIYAAAAVIDATCDDNTNTTLLQQVTGILYTFYS